MDGAPEVGDPRVSDPRVADPRRPRTTQPPPPAAHAAEVVAELEEAKASFERTWRTMDPDEPSMAIWSGLGSLAGGMAGFSQQLDQGTLAAVLAAREAAQAEAQAAIATMHAAAAEAAAETVQGTVDGVIERVDEALTHRSRHFDRMLAITVAGLLVFGILGAGVGGYFFGRAQRDREMVETATGLQAALGGSGTAADMWRRLIDNNDIVASLAAPATQHGHDKASGRDWVQVGLWLGPRKPAAVGQ